MRVKFYFDPACPFSWITSRWLSLVGQHRDIEIDWQPFSLAIKNDEVDKDDSDKYAKEHRNSLLVLRLMYVASTEYQIDMAEMYSFAGHKFHINKQPYDTAMLEQIVDQFDLPGHIISQAESTAVDQALADNIKQAVDLVGNDVGVPIMVFENPTRDIGYFGPVLQSMPELEESLSLWDGLSVVATTNSFYELKRSRPKTAPDTQSTLNA